MVEQVGQVMLRAETIDSVVKNVALQEFVMKQLVMVNGSSAWKESYFQETNTELTASGTRSIRGIPRLAEFPNMDPTWGKVTSYNEKYGGKVTISIEDEMTNEIDVISRALLRVARAVVNAVDTQIWNVLTENQSASLINTEVIASGNEWNSSTIANRDPIQNILNAIRQISIDNLNALNGDGFLVLSPTDFANVLGNANVRNAGQFYTSDVTANGRVGRILGLNVIVSNVVTADYAAVIIAKTCGTWKEVSPLTVRTTVNEGISKTITAWQIGVCQLVTPNAVCLISNTQA